MRKPKTDNLRNTLEYGRVRQLRAAERLFLWLAGWRDGVRGLPALNEEGVWTSPHLNRECNAYEEYCAKTWGRQQIKLETRYSALSHLLRSCERASREYSTSQVELAAQEAEALSQGARKKGEDGLTEQQIAIRRAREQKKRLAAVRARVREAEAKLETTLDNLTSLHTDLLETEHSTRMACGRIREHTLQRADAYWNSALRRHKNRDQLPLTPHLICMDRAEAQYRKSHEALMRQAEEVIRRAAGKEEFR